MIKISAVISSAESDLSALNLWPPEHNGFLKATLLGFFLVFSYKVLLAKHLGK